MTTQAGYPDSWYDNLRLLTRNKINIPFISSLMISRLLGFRRMKRVSGCTWRTFLCLITNTISIGQWSHGAARYASVSSGSLYRMLTTKHNNNKWTNPGLSNIFEILFSMYYSQYLLSIQLTVFALLLVKLAKRSPTAMRRNEREAIFQIL